MARVTPSDVEEIAEFEELSSSDIQPFIEDAHNLVNTQAADVYEGGTLELLEKYLAAHLAASREQRVSRVAVGESEVTYEGRSGMKLRRTRYGQQVLTIDYQGLLEGYRNYHRAVN